MAIAIVIGCAVHTGCLKVFLPLYQPCARLTPLGLLAAVCMRLFVIVHFLTQANCVVNPCICFIICANYRQGLIQKKI